MRKLFKSVLAISATALLIGCGGGGSSSDKTMVTITDSNAEQVLATATQSMQSVLEIGDAFGTNISGPMTPESGTETCSGGGSVTYNITEYSGSFTFNQCVEHNIGLTLDGKAVASINGDTIIAQYTGFNLKAHDYAIELYYEAASAEINSRTSNINGSVTGYVIADNSRVDVEQYTFSKASNIYTYNGLVKTNCIGSWVQVKTNQPLELSNYGRGCPISGEVVTIGDNSELKTVFNSDKSIDVFLNGQSYTSYSDCNALPSVVEVCS